MFARTTFLVPVLPLAGCLDGPTHLPRYEPKPMPTAPAIVAIERPSAPVVAPVRDEDLLERRRAIKRRALAAVALDAHPKGEEWAVRLSNCNPLRSCQREMDAWKKESEAAVLAGQALNEMNFGLKGVEAAEIDVDVAVKIAAKDGRVRSALAARQDAEEKAIEAILPTCEKTAATCISKCKSGDAAACGAMGIFYSNGKKYDEAKKSFQLSCDAGNMVGCEFVPKMDNMRAAEARKVDDAWSELRAAGDDLAVKRFLMATTATLPRRVVANFPRRSKRSRAGARQCPLRSGGRAEGDGLGIVCRRGGCACPASHLETRHVAFWDDGRP